MADTYTTKQGDCWDGIAFAVYGSESHTGWLMEHNYPLLDIYQFDDGAVLSTPPLTEETTQQVNRPVWRATSA